MKRGVVVIPLRFSFNLILAASGLVFEFVFCSSSLTPVFLLHRSLLISQTGLCHFLKLIRGEKMKLHNGSPP